MHKQNGREIRRSLLLGVGIGIVLALVFSAGFFARDLLRFVPAVAAQGTDQFPLLDEVQALLDQHYLRQQPSQTEREYAAIRGLLSSLNDRFTFFIEPPTAASESDVLAGTYGGIGVQIHRNEQGQFALYPYKDSPAAVAGIADGDILTQINGQPLDPNVGQDSIDQMMRGEVKQGNGVQITVTQAASGKSLTVLIPFAVINVPSVTYRVLAEDPTIGYVQISIITSRTPDELKAALQDLTSKNVKSLVLDLRNNTGGLLEESVQVANAFIASGPIVFEDNKQGEQTYSAQSSGLITALPMVVLVNGMTASGAELIAGAIQDDQRGVLIGQKTYGKGTVQEIFSLSDKSSLHITAAEWLTPKKHHLDGVGLTPDIPVTPDAQGRDLELGQAVQYLEGKPGTVAATPQAASQTNAVTISTTEAATTSP